MGENQLQQVDQAISRSVKAFKKWRVIPPPVRGEFVRRIGEAFRKNKEAVANQIVEESRKIKSEALGEVQEVIDICDFAVGLSRQLHGLTIASERPLHRMMEQWMPLGPVGVITAFNFPVAVWGWNAALALVCGDPVIWKPSDKTPKCAKLCMKLISQVAKEMDPDGKIIEAGLLEFLPATKDAGIQLVESKEVPLISATGSTKMGRLVAKAVAERLGRSILELGGNNGMIITETADLALARRAIVFSAVGTCGQRCTSLRRLMVHTSIMSGFVVKLIDAYKTLKIGDPMKSDTLVGPLIDAVAFDQMQKAIKRAKAEGGTVIVGGDRVPSPKGLSDDFFVNPCIITMPNITAVVREETFAPILYVMPYADIEHAIELNNGVPQGLSSSIFTNDIREAELFMSAAGSDCGIANVNIGTSGAEIGGAFGGEKDTGGGRESGSDCWKAYMRRTTNTINYSSELPLAQGVTFE